MTDKYRNLYFFDRDELEIRRIIQIEWKQRSRGVVAQHFCFTALVMRVDEDDSASEGTNDTGEEELESYDINETLHEMIKDAPHPYNNGRKMVAAEL